MSRHGAGLPANLPERHPKRRRLHSGQIRELALAPTGAVLNAIDYDPFHLLRVAIGRRM